MLTHHDSQLLKPTRLLALDMLTSILSPFSEPDMTYQDRLESDDPETGSLDPEHIRFPDTIPTTYSNVSLSGRTQSSECTTSESDSSRSTSPHASNHSSEESLETVTVHRSHRDHNHILSQAYHNDHGTDWPALNISCSIWSTSFILSSGDGRVGRTLNLEG